MTKKELSQLYYLNREIEREKRRLRELEEASTRVTARVSGLPFGASGGNNSPTALGADIADAKAIIEAKTKASIAEYNRLVRYINSIDDSFIRQILMLRYVDCLSWNAIAQEIGGNTADSVRMAHNRFLAHNRLTEQ